MRPWTTPWERSWKRWVRPRPGVQGLIAVVIGLAVAAEVRRFKEQKAREEAELRAHRLRERVVEAQLSQAESQRTAVTSLNREVDGWSKSKGVGSGSARDDSLLNPLKARLHTLHYHAAILASRLAEMQVEGAPDQDLAELGQALRRLQRMIAEANQDVAHASARAFDPE